MKNFFPPLKIKLVVALVSLSGFNNALCQNSAHLIFNCGQQPCTLVSPKPKLNYIREGGEITITYKNVNPFAINSNLKGTPSNADYKDGAEALQSILSASQAAQKTTQAQVATAAASVNKKNNLTTAMLRKTGTKKQNLDLIIEPVDDLSPLLDLKTLSLNKIDSVRLSLSVETDAITNVLGLEQIINTAMSDSSIISKDIMTDRIKKSSGIAFTSIGDVSKMFDESLAGCRKDVIVLKEQLNTLTEINFKIKKLDPTSGFDSTINTLSTSIATLEDVYFGSKNVADMRTKIMNIKCAYTQIEQSDFTVAGKTTFFHNDDELVISDSLLTLHNSLYRKISPIKFYSYGGTRIDLALGLAVTFGNINPTSYYIVRDTSGKATDLKNSRANSLGNFSPMVFIHFTKKWNSSMSGALSFGINPDFSSVGNSKLLLGLSLACTQSNNIAQRLVFTAGIGGGLTDVLLPKYSGITSENANYLLTNKSETELTEKALRFGPFFAISFNLAQLKK